MKEKQVLGRIMGMADAYRQSWALFTAIELGVFDALFGRALSVEEVATRTQSSARRLKSLLNLLAVYGLMVRKGATYTLHPDVEPLADPNRTDCIQKRLAHAIRTARSWPRATEVFRQDRPVSQLPDAPPRDPADIEAFHASLGINSYAMMKRLLPFMSLPEGCRILDVGGGFGDVCRPILETDPLASALVLESPATSALGENQLRNQRLDRRLAFHGCDFIHDPLPEGFDLVVASNILHIYDAQTNQELLSRLHKSLRDGGQIVVREVPMNEAGDGPEVGLQFAMHMAINTDAGDVYPAHEIIEWLGGAGFNSVHCIAQLSELGTVLVGTKRPPTPCNACGTVG